MTSRMTESCYSLPASPQLSVPAATYVQQQYSPIMTEIPAEAQVQQRAGWLAGRLVRLRHSVDVEHAFWHTTSDDFRRI